MLRDFDVTVALVVPAVIAFLVSKKRKWTVTRTVVCALILSLIGFVAVSAYHYLVVPSLY
jgi:nucleoside permease NupC